MLLDLGPFTNRVSFMKVVRFIFLPLTHYHSHHSMNSKTLQNRQIECSQQLPPASRNTTTAMLSQQKAMTNSPENYHTTTAIVSNILIRLKRPEKAYMPHILKFITFTGHAILTFTKFTLQNQQNKLNMSLQASQSLIVTEGNTEANHSPCALQVQRLWTSTNLYLMHRVQSTQQRMYLGQKAIFRGNNGTILVPINY